MKIRALIVDDEPLARERVKELLAAEPDAEVCGECRNGQEARAAFASLSPDVVFLDVRMPGMDGFDLLASLAAGPPPRIVFVTAFDRYAVRAFEAQALDYLLKPLDRERFKRAFQKVREATGTASSRDDAGKLLALLKDLEARRGFRTRFTVQEEGRFLLLNAEDVDCLEAEGNYVRLHAGPDSHLVRESLSDLEASLDPGDFLRVHRSWIVNVGRVREVQKWFHGGYVLILRSGLKIPVGRTHREKIERHLGLRR